MWIIYVQPHFLPIWEMNDFPGNKHEALAFNTYLYKALPSLWWGKIAWEYLASGYPTMSLVKVMLLMPQWQHISGLIPISLAEGHSTTQTNEPPYSHSAGFQFKCQFSRNKVIIFEWIWLLTFALALQLGILFCSLIYNKFNSFCLSSIEFTYRWTLQAQ